MIKTEDELRTGQAPLEARLSDLDPQPEVVADPAHALARFRAVTLPANPTLRTVIRRRLDMIRQDLQTDRSFRRWRPAAVGLTAVLCLAILFSFAPARQAAAQFLGLFRVRKFAVIPLDSSQARQLEGLAQMADEGRFGQPTSVREPSQGPAVSGAAEATALAGYPVRVPAALPQGVVLKAFRVDVGPALHYEIDRTIMQALLDATQIRNVSLPDQTIVIDVDIPAVVVQEFAAPNGRVSLVQFPSPELDLPAGLDPVMLSEAAFRFLGMPDSDAGRLARSIDWTSTMVIPLPADAARSREVTVDGTQALLLEGTPRNGPSMAGRAGGPVTSSVLLWQKDGIIYGMEAANLDAKALLQMADSLQ